MRKPICEVLGFNKSTFYYQPKVNPSEDILRDEIETLAARYPTYGYRRIRALLLRQGYTVGYKRVARLMREANLSVCCQTTRSSQTARFAWVNRLESLEVSVPDQVWVGDITYVRLKGHFVYVALLIKVHGLETPYFSGGRKIRPLGKDQNAKICLTFRPNCGIISISGWQAY